MNVFCYFTFPSTYQAVKAEKALSRTSLEFKMVPVPRSISSSCGTSLRCLPEQAEAIRQIFIEESIEIEDYHELEEKSSSGPLAYLFKRGGKENG